MVDNLPGCDTTDHFAWQVDMDGDGFRPPKGLWFAMELMSNPRLGPVSPRKTLLEIVYNWQIKVTE